MRNLGLVLSFLLVTPPLLALSETDYARVRAEAEAWYFDHRVQETFGGVGGVRLDSVSFPAPSDDVALVIMGGRTESHLKYSEVFRDLRGWGWSMFMFDPRGQGLSQRLLDNTQKQHVEDFDDYVEDLRLFLDGVVRRRPFRKVFILAHSMGGLIATRYSEEHPLGVDALVLSSPMHRFYTAPFPEPVAIGLGWGGVLLAHGDDYGPTQGDDDGKETFENNRVSHSRARWEYNRALADRFPLLRMGGVTYRWVQQAFGAAQSARHRADRLVAPVLILQSGEDTVVRNDGQDAVCSLARDCRKQLFDGARHELLQEVDAIRGPVLERARAFLEAERQDDWKAGVVAGCTSSTVGGAGSLALALAGWARATARRRPRRA